MIIFEELVYQEALRRHLAVAPAKLAKAEADFRKQFSTDQAYGQFLVTETNGSQAAMRETIRQAGVPAPIVNATIISLIEFICGALLLIGFLTRFASFMLIGVMLGALTTTVLPKVKAKNAFDWLGQFFYLPEVLYLIILLWLFLAGPGRFSIDYSLVFRG